MSNDFNEDFKVNIVTPGMISNKEKTWKFEVFSKIPIDEYKNDKKEGWNC